jgi:hypothetical protein
MNHDHGILLAIRAAAIINQFSAGNNWKSHSRAPGKVASALATRYDRPRHHFAKPRLVDLGIIDLQPGESHDPPVAIRSVDQFLPLFSIERRTAEVRSLSAWR